MVNPSGVTPYPELRTDRDNDECVREIKAWFPGRVGFVVSLYSQLTTTLPLHVRCIDRSLQMSVLSVLGILQSIRSNAPVYTFLYGAVVIGLLYNLFKQSNVGIMSAFKWISLTISN